MAASLVEKESACGDVYPPARGMVPESLPGPHGAARHLQGSHSAKFLGRLTTLVQEAVIDPPRHYRCIGIGVGPANLSLAALMHSHPEITNLFVDKKER